MATAAATRRFTASEYHRMAEVGILKPDDRVELLAGEIIPMAPMSSRHAAAIHKIAEFFQGTLAEFFQGTLGKRAIVSVQCPVRLDDYSEPQPDVALLRPNPSYYADAHPRPSDVLLLIEVAQTSLTFDRDVKVPSYGRFGVAETWLVNLELGQVEVFRAPGARGYAAANPVRRGEWIAPEAFPDARVLVDELLA